MQFIQFIKGLTAVERMHGTGYTSSALSLHGIYVGSQRASQETQIYSECGTVSLVSPRSCTL